MQCHGLLLERHSGRRPGRVHDGKVVVMRSNLRWCSDVFEIACWNGDIVRVAFVIDAHDREVIGWHGVAGTGIGGEAICDLMLAAVETRFGASWCRTPSNGCPTMAAPTRQRTPATSPVVWACSPASPRSPAPRAMASPRPWSGRSNATTFASTRCRTPSRCSDSSTGGSPTTTTTTPTAGSACALPGSSSELTHPPPVPGGGNTTEQAPAPVQAGSPVPVVQPPSRTPGVVRARYLEPEAILRRHHNGGR